MENEEKSALVERWYYQYAQMLFHAACLLDTPDAAEEIVQETFRIVMETDKLDEVAFPKAWLRKVLYNTVRNRRRANLKSACLSIDSGQVPLELLGSREDERDVELDYSGMIPREDLHLLRLALVERRAYAEISEELGISIKACQKRVERTKRKLRIELEEDGS